MRLVEVSSTKKFIFMIPTSLQRKDIHDESRQGHGQFYELATLRDVQSDGASELKIVNRFIIRSSEPEPSSLEGYLLTYLYIYTIFAGLYAVWEYFCRL